MTLQLSDSDPHPSLVSSCLENLQDSKGASVVAAKQRKILLELKQEQVILEPEELDFIF